MALVCDYCGNVADSNRTTVAFGHNQEIALKGATAQKWFYYCDDECAEAVKVMLENLRLYAMHGEGSGLMWQLVQQDRLNPPRRGTVEPVTVAESEAAKVKREDAELTIHHRRLLGVLGGTGPSNQEIKERAVTGTCLLDALPHAPTTRKIIEGGNVVTLEEVADLCEAQFRGINGVGTSSMEAIGPALKAAGLSFKDGPTGQQMCAALRKMLKERNWSVSDLHESILKTTDHPDENASGGKTRASEELFTAIWKLWEKRSPPPPMVLSRIADTFGYTVDGFLELAESLSVSPEVRA